ncbi:hypothetical protein G6514_001441 [Epicoccum nigrum]|nr:hypothetical protein G6514_001441 [Epicoccum nigrum]
MEEIWDHRFLPRHETESLNHIRTSMVSQRLGTNTVVDETSIWWEAVNEYSMRDLTNPFDKLPAIRGLAVHLHDSCLGGTQSRYITGQWTNSMAARLLWYVDLGAERPRPDLYRAPNWSWASVEGVIFNDSLPRKDENAGIEIIEIDIKDHDVCTRPIQPWLQDRCIPGSSITLLGSIKAARWSQASSDSEKRYYVARSLVRHRHAYLETPSALKDLFSAISIKPRVGPLCHALFDPASDTRIGWFFPNYPELLPSDIFCLMIKVTPVDPEDAQAAWAVRGLVLVPDATPTITEQIPGRSKSPIQAPHDAARFYRIGYFELDCEFQGTHVGSAYSRTDQVAMPRRPDIPVRRYVEFPVANEPRLDPLSFFEV